MNRIEPIQISIENAELANISEIAEIIRLHGVAGIRTGREGGELFETLTIGVSENLGWMCRFKGGDFFRYEEDHSTIKDLAICGSETPVVPWHISGIHEEFPHAGVFWKMQSFSASNGCGRTGFFDCEYLAEIISPKWKELLKASKIVHNNQDEQQPRNPIDINPVTGKETIRIRTDSDQCEEHLFSVEDREPTESEQSIFRQISIWTFFNARSNTQHQHFWEWEEGDIVIVDLFRMAYSVFGGFKPEERKIVGHWAFYE